MKKIFLIPAVAIALFLGACGDSQSKTAESETVVVNEPEHHHAEASEVQLDNGEKWEANPETTEGVDKMILAVNDAQASEQPDFLALKAELEEEFRVVLEKCTMKGESHEQLHNYLLPLKATIDQLDANSDKQALGHLDQYLLTYKNFFN